MIDMENMFDLMAEPHEVKNITLEVLWHTSTVNVQIRDDENATEFKLGDGKIEMRNVKFGYKPDQLILDDVSFTVEAGQTLALVSDDW